MSVHEDWTAQARRGDPHVYAVQVRRGVASVDAQGMASCAQAWRDCPGLAGVSRETACGGLIALAGLSPSPAVRVVERVGGEERVVEDAPARGVQAAAR